ncbi:MULTISPECIES: hypothetical protein [unclassified Arthrobacter]|uniref:hypothetical protein n=1 Tax=unclassified Arthrobacter TaxID=235627 RepID=UPI003394A93A
MRYEQMLDALEEVEDIAAFDAAMAEEGENIPWAQVKADLGWARPTTGLSCDQQPSGHSGSFIRRIGSEFTAQ